MQMAGEKMTGEPLRLVIRELGLLGFGGNRHFSPSTRRISGAELFLSSKALEKNSCKLTFWLQFAFYIGFVGISTFLYLDWIIVKQIPIDSQYRMQLKKGTFSITPAIFSPTNHAFRDRLTSPYRKGTFRLATFRDQSWANLRRALVTFQLMGRGPSFSSSARNEDARESGGCRAMWPDREVSTIATMVGMRH
jgi:hypothetical protein